MKYKGFYHIIIIIYFIFLLIYAFNIINCNKKSYHFLITKMFLYYHLKNYLNLKQKTIKKK